MNLNHCLSFQIEVCHCSAPCLTRIARIENTSYRLQTHTTIRRYQNALFSSFRDHETVLRFLGTLVKLPPSHKEIILITIAYVLDLEERCVEFDIKINSLFSRAFCASFRVSNISYAKENWNSLDLDQILL